MKHLSWDLKKNDLIKSKRGISFEEIAYLIEPGKILGIEENPRHLSQRLYIFEIDNYAVVEPFTETEKKIILKTAFPSRKFTKLYNLKGK